jgi:serine/threonine protein kinase
MAIVQLAKKPCSGFEQLVALKRLRPEYAGHPKMVKWFVREAKLAAMLRHENIARVHELGRFGDTYYIVMEHVEGYHVGEILRQAVRSEQRVPVAISLWLLGQLCDALDYVHTCVHDLTGEPLGIVHRDISPSNLIVTHDGNLKLIDFGIAEAALEEWETKSGYVRGKTGYMSPEALRGQPLDARSDIYSIGVVAYELLTGLRLFPGSSKPGRLWSLRKTIPKPPSLCNPECPTALDRVVLKALAGDPAQRWSSAKELRKILHHVSRLYHLTAASDETAVWVDGLFSGSDDTSVEAVRFADGSQKSAPAVVRTHDTVRDPAMLLDEVTEVETNPGPGVRRYRR